MHTITFKSEHCYDDETRLLAFCGEEYVGDLRYCDGDPFGDDQDLLVVWTITIEPQHRRLGYAKALLEQMRSRHPEARWLELDVGTLPAHAVTRSWLGLPHAAPDGRYPLR